MSTLNILLAQLISLMQVRPPTAEHICSAENYGAWYWKTLDGSLSARSDGAEPVWELHIPIGLSFTGLVYFYMIWQEQCGLELN